MLGNPYIRLANNFLHDMGTGLWAACLLVLWVLAQRMPGMPADAAIAVSSAMSAVFTLLIVALAIIGITGMPRILYWRMETPAEELFAKRRSLIVKHVAFAAIYGGGTAWGWALLP